MAPKRDLAIQKLACKHSRVGGRFAKLPPCAACNGKLDSLMLIAGTHAVSNRVIARMRRHSCLPYMLGPDICLSELFTQTWFCTRCGFDLCNECAKAIQTVSPLIASRLCRSFKPDRASLSGHGRWTC